MSEGGVPGEGSFTFANGKAVPDSGFDDALLFATLKKASFRSAESDGTTGTVRTGGTAGEGTVTATGTDGSELGTPLHERSEWLTFGPAAGGRYPSPVRNSRVEIPMPVRRESFTCGAASGSGSGDAPAEVLSEEREKERFKSGLRRGLSSLSIPFVGPVRRTSGLNTLAGEPQLRPGLGMGLGSTGVGGSSSETIELPVIREREQEPEEPEGEEGEGEGPMLGRFSAANEASAVSPLDARQPRSPTSPSRRPPPPQPVDLPRSPMDV